MEWRAFKQLHQRGTHLGVAVHEVAGVGVGQPPALPGLGVGTAVAAVAEALADVVGIRMADNITQAMGAPLGRR